MSIRAEENEQRWPQISRSYKRFILINNIVYLKNMPVDKFGHTDSGSTLRVVAGGVTLTQINNFFLRLDGTNAFAGNLNMGGYSIEGLSATYTPSEDNHLTTKKYVDEQD